MSECHARFLRRAHTDDGALDRLDGDRFLYDAEHARALYDKRQSLLSALCVREPTGNDEISCATEYLHTSQGAGQTRPVNSGKLLVDMSLRTCAQKL